MVCARRDLRRPNIDQSIVNRPTKYNGCEARTVVCIIVRRLDADAAVLFSHVSPFVFTNRLLPLLKETAEQPGADVRIVNVSILTIAC